MKRFLWLTLLYLLALNACQNNKHKAVVTTFAGSGLMGAVDGKGTAASFGNPMGVTVDNSGNVYVADSYNNVIRKITPDGEVTTFAGTGIPGSADGKSVKASFFYPGGLFADNHGNILVADTHNSLIRQITPDRTVTSITIINPGSSGNKGDSLIRLDNPSGIAEDAMGNLLVADRNNDLIRKISPKGKVIILAGSRKPGALDGAGAKATFYLPGGIAIDSTGNIYISDSYNNIIRKITPDGKVTTLAGQKKKGDLDGKGESASFRQPEGIALDNQGNIVVADMGNNKIRKITPDGIVTTVAGSGMRGATDGPVTSASFNRPYGVAVDKKGNIFVADFQNNKIRKISF
jgi:sugar lactone lactonase YvrE